MRKLVTERVPGAGLYNQFQGLLERPGLRMFPDLREDILSRRLLPHRIGFQRNNLETAFSANLGRLFPNLIAVDEPGIDSDAPVLMYGAILDDLSKSHDSTKNLLPHVSPDAPVLFCEMGFLASTTSWSEAIASRDPKQACLGYIFDDRAQYYMSDRETRLDEKLNGDFQLTDEQRQRALRAIQRIVDARISKYNSQPFFRPEVSPDHKRRVLVVDQNFSDASTFYGRATESDFRAMLKAAVDENPDAEILVKTHPDLNWVKGGKRRGYFDQLTSEGRVRILRDSVNPFELFDLVDKVYVGTSGMGLEALLAGKEVVCFGAPCYAGWGLTDDRVVVPHRHRGRDLAEFFHAFYIWYTIYHLPEGEVPAQIEDVLDFIEANRPVQPRPAEAPSAPMVSIIIPVHGVERYIAQCLASIQRQSLQDFEVILVDDVSPDRSVEVIEGYAAADPRIRLVRRTRNVGPGFARNQGMDLARGRYVLFIDPDDYMPDPLHLQRIVAMAEEDGADLVRFRKRREQVENEAGKILQMRKDITERFFPREVRRTTIADHPEIAHSRHFWNWLYRRDFLDQKNIRFLTAYREERAFLLQAYMADPVVSICDSDGVVYRIRQDSAVRRAQSMSDVMDQLANFEAVTVQMGQAGALEKGSPHWWLARFQVSQFLHYLYFGFAWKTAKAANKSGIFLDHLARSLEQWGMGPDDLITDPAQLSKLHVRAGAYKLLLAATCMRRADLVETALSLSPISSKDLHATFLQVPASAAERNLQQALNAYARNDRVTPTGDPEAVSGKRPRILIHLGATKTGSTTLQHLLEDNRPALLRKGIWYPEVGLFWQPDRPHKQAGHARFVVEAAAGTQDLRRYLLSGLAQMPGQVHTIVLSSEAFFLNENSAALAQHFRDFDVEMVVYLRRQDEWANSQYAEFVAGGAISSTSLRIEQWLQLPATRRCLDYEALLKNWQQHLPQAAIHLRRYLRSPGNDWNIIEDFVAATGLSELADLPPPPLGKTNDARLSAAHVELIRLYNKRRFFNKGAYLRFIEAAASGLNAWRKARGMPMPSPWLLSEQQADRIMASAEAGNGRIARDYFGLEPDQLFPARSPAPSPCGIYPEEFEIVEAAFEAANARTPKEKSGETIVNYGIFSWRRWSAVPLISAAYHYRGRPDLARDVQADPADFARRHWMGRRAKLRWLAYSNASTLGPRQVLRLWLPVLTPLVRWRLGDGAVDRLHSNPVGFVRDIKNPVYRLVGRALFPMGDKC